MHGLMIAIEYIATSWTEKTILIYGPVIAQTVTYINGPLSSHVLSDMSIGQPRGIRGLVKSSDELAASNRKAASEEKKRGPYDR